MTSICSEHRSFPGERVASLATGNRTDLRSLSDSRDCLSPTQGAMCPQSLVHCIFSCRLICGPFSAPGMPEPTQRPQVLVLSLVTAECPCEIPDTARGLAHIPHGLLGPSHSGLECEGESRGLPVNSLAGLGLHLRILASSHRTQGRRYPTLSEELGVEG
jgi:hypothetical protein